MKSACKLSKFTICIMRENAIVLYSSFSGKIVMIEGRGALAMYEEFSCVNYLPFNLQYMNTPQAEFLSGTPPDAIVLCFSPEDSLRDISRTLSYCESYVANSKVIALVLYPIKQERLFGNGILRRIPLSQREVLDIKASFSTTKELPPVLLLGDEIDMKKLFSIVLLHFS